MARYRQRITSHLHTGWHEVMHWLYDPVAFGRKAYRVRFPLAARTSDPGPVA